MEWLPDFLAMGYTEDIFWNMTMYQFKAYQKAYKLKQKKLDEDMWHLGQYIVTSVSMAIDMCFNGPKSTAKYPEKPIFWDMYENTELSKEEQYKRKVERLKAIDVAWIEGLKNSNLPSTKSMLKDKE